MSGVLADWTTARWGQVTIMTYVWTVLTATIFVLCVIDLVRSYRYVLNLQQVEEEALRVAIIGGLLRSLGRVGVQMLLLGIAAISILIQLEATRTSFYWYRVLFTVFFIGAEVLMGLMVVNDDIVRRRILGIRE